MHEQIYRHSVHLLSNVLKRFEIKINYNKNIQIDQAQLDAGETV